MNNAFHYDGRTVTLVVNPTSGRGRAGRLLPRVCADLLTAFPDLHLRVHRTTSFAEARLRCIQAVDAARPAGPDHPADSLVVMGGDGMAHLGVNACAGTDVPLGVIPAGTGNDFCRGAGLPTTIARALEAVGAGRTRRMDVAKVTGALVGGAQERFVGSVVSTGYDARVTRRANAIPSRLGGLGYGWAAIAELSTFEPLRYRLTLDGREEDLHAMLVAVGNAGVFGGGMRICPEARVDDGRLDVTIIHPVSRATLLRLLPTTYTGGFVKDPAVELRTASEVRIDGDGLFGMADGEDLGAVPLNVRCLPGSLLVLDDEGAPDRGAEPGAR